MSLRCAVSRLVRCERPLERWLLRPLCRPIFLLTYLAVCLSIAQVSVAEEILPDPLEAGWRGKPVCEKLHDDETRRVLRCTFTPGVGHERHFHAPHFGYAISGGRVRITDGRGARELELATGSSFASDGVEWHEVLNVGETTIVYLIVESK